MTILYLGSIYRMSIYKDKYPGATWVIVQNEKHIPLQFDHVIFDSRSMMTVPGWEGIYREINSLWGNCKCCDISCYLPYCQQCRQSICNQEQFPGRMDELATEFAASNDLKWWGVTTGRDHLVAFINYLKEIRDEIKA